MSRDWSNIDEVARRLGVGRATVYSYKKWPGFPKDGTVEDIRQFMVEKKTQNLQYGKRSVFRENIGEGPGESAVKDAAEGPPPEHPDETGSEFDEAEVRERRAIAEMLKAEEAAMNEKLIRMEKEGSLISLEETKTRWARNVATLKQRFEAVGEQVSQRLMASIPDPKLTSLVKDQINAEIRAILLEASGMEEVTA